MPKLQNHKIIAIIIAFFPEGKSLNQSIESLSRQCNSIIVVDNTPHPCNSNTAELLKESQVNLISLGRNFGIAYAQNIGIKAAMDANADFVLIMDQDSIPENEMVAKLHSAFEDTRSNNLIAAGPTYIDPRTNVRSYFMVSCFGLPFRYRPSKEKDSKNIVDVAFLISSGTLISVPKLIELGGMRSNYFIDHVDTEWCLRAKEKGFSLAGVISASMEHSLGDKVKRVWLFYLRSVAHHSPLRDYYMFRNTLLMLHDVKIPFLWKCFVISRLFPFAVYFLLFGKDRNRRLKKMRLGLKHGFLGIDGELNLDSRACTPIPKTSLDPV